MVILLRGSGEVAMLTSAIEGAAIRDGYGTTEVVLFTC